MFTVIEKNCKYLCLLVHILFSFICAHIRYQNDSKYYLAFHIRFFNSPDFLKFGAQTYMILIFFIPSHSMENINARTICHNLLFALGTFADSFDSCEFFFVQFMQASYDDIPYSSLSYIRVRNFKKIPY